MVRERRRDVEVTVRGKRRRNDRKNRRLACGVCTSHNDQDLLVMCPYGNGCYKVYCTMHHFSGGFMVTMYGCRCEADAWANFFDMAPRSSAAIKPSARGGKRHLR